MQDEAKQLAEKFLQSGSREESFTYTISNSNENIIIKILRTRQGKDTVILERFDHITKKINSQEISFLPAGACACCGR